METEFYEIINAWESQDITAKECYIKAKELFLNVVYNNDDDFLTDYYNTMKYCTKCNEYHE